MSAALLELPWMRNKRFVEAAGSYTHLVSKYANFEDIPEAIRSEEALVAWMTFLGRDLKSIPPEYRSEFVLEAAVMMEKDALRFIKPEDTSQYEDLVLLGLQKNSAQLKYLPEDLLTASFITKACLKSAGVIEQIEWGYTNPALINPCMIKEIGSASIHHASALARCAGRHEDEVLDDEVLRTALKSSSALSLIQVENWQRAKSVFLQMIEEGYWPSGIDEDITDEFSQGRDHIKPPATIEETLSDLLQPALENYHFLYAMVMKTFPIEEVIQALSRDEESLEILFRVYTFDELRPHMQISRAMRGRLLEQEIGL